MRAVLSHLLGHRSDRQPPASPPPAQSDREAPEAQRFYPGSRACTFCTSQSRYHHLLLPYLGEGWKDLLRLAVSHFCLRRPVHHSGWEWMTFRPAWGQWSFHLGRRWTAVHPGSMWIPVRSHWGWWGPVRSFPRGSRRRSLGLSWLWWEEVYHKGGHQVS